MAFLKSEWGGPYGRNCSMNSRKPFGRRAIEVTVDMHDDFEFEDETHQPSYQTLSHR